MKLPQAERAVLDRKKIVEFFLNAAHPDNGGKAAFFERLGFHSAEWRTLAPHGEKYLIVGTVRSLSGKTASVKTIWILNKGQEAPRLVTAYSAKR